MYIHAPCTSYMGIVPLESILHAPLSCRNYISSYILPIGNLLQPSHDRGKVYILCTWGQCHDPMHLVPIVKPTLCLNINVFHAFPTTAFPQLCSVPNG